MYNSRLQQICIRLLAKYSMYLNCVERSQVGRQKMVNFDKRAYCGSFRSEQKDENENKKSNNKRKRNTRKGPLYE